MSTRELDLLRHQVDEINAANFQPDEETELMNRYRRANSAARLLENTTAAMALLAGEEDGILTRLGEMQRHIRDLEKLDPSIGERCTGLETAVVELQELESTLADYLDELEINPEEAAALEDRVNQLESLKRKYGGSIGNILLARDEASNRLDNIENRGEKLDLLQAQITELRSQLDAAANKLSSTRRKAAPKLAKEIAAQLKDLGFKQSAFEISLTALKDPSSHGMESTDFLFGPNPGEPLHPLRHVASSGEISRVMLAVKSALADQDATPLMVFDEIDANVGGEDGLARSHASGHRHHSLPASGGDSCQTFRRRERNQPRPHPISSIPRHRRSAHSRARAHARRRWRICSRDGQEPVRILIPTPLNYGQVPFSKRSQFSRLGCDKSAWDHCLRAYE